MLSDKELVEKVVVDALRFAHSMGYEVQTAFGETVREPDLFFVQKKTKSPMQAPLKYEKSIERMFPPYYIFGSHGISSVVDIATVDDMTVATTTKIHALKLIKHRDQCIQTIVKLANGVPLNHILYGEPPAPPLVAVSSEPLSCFIHIDKCTDPTAWYAKLVGQTIPFEKYETMRSHNQGIPEDVYWCREGGTYNAINYVRVSDATICSKPVSFT